MKRDTYQRGLPGVKWGIWNTGSHVFLYLYGRVLDAMEDFHITLEAK